MSGDTSLPENATVEGRGVLPNDDTENITIGQLKNKFEVESAYREEASMKKTFPILVLNVNCDVCGFTFHSKDSIQLHLTK